MVTVSIQLINTIPTFGISGKNTTYNLVLSVNHKANIAEGYSSLTLRPYPQILTKLPVFLVSPVNPLHNQ